MKRLSHVFEGELHSSNFTQTKEELDKETNETPTILELAHKISSVYLYTKKTVVNYLQIELPSNSSIIIEIIEPIFVSFVKFFMLRVVN